MKGQPPLECRLQACLRAHALGKSDHARIACFVAGFDPASANPYFNYAVPDDGAQPDPSDVAALVAAFEERGLKPRLEYIAAAAPAVEPALRDAGFVVEARLAVMICNGTKDVAPSSAAFTHEIARDDADIAEAAQAQARAFGNDDPDPERLRRLLAQGGIVAVARECVSGDVVGAGTATATYRGVAEITGIGVLPAFRRHGIACALTAVLARETQARGTELVWLTPGDRGAERIYARVGFAAVAEQLHTSKPLPETQHPRC